MIGTSEKAVNKQIELLSKQIGFVVSSELAKTYKADKEKKEGIKAEVRGKLYDFFQNTFSNSYFVSHALYRPNEQAKYYFLGALQIETKIEGEPLNDAFEKLVAEVRYLDVLIDQVVDERKSFLESETDINKLKKFQMGAARRVAHKAIEVVGVAVMVIGVAATIAAFCFPPVTVGAALAGVTGSATVGGAFAGMTTFNIAVNASSIIILGHLLRALGIEPVESADKRAEEAQRSARTSFSDEGYKETSKKLYDILEKSELIEKGVVEFVKAENAKSR